MEEKVLDTINKYNLIKSGDILLIGVSGGPDSICLLYILNKLKDKLGFEIFVAHINHMIRKEAMEETKYVQDFCKSLQVECFIKKANILDIAKKGKKGIEETGRKIRYEFFDEIANKIGAKKIVTAHNNNDKVETIIMNILRGSGTSGLKGLMPIRNEKYIKPLIECKREDIEEYCIENNLNPKYDKSNNDNTYIRNKIRNIVIPYIKKEFNPNILDTINRLSEVITEEDLYISNIVEEKYTELLLENDIVKKQIILDLKKFNSLELVIRRKLILYTINKLLGTTNGIEKVNIDDIVKLCNNNIGNKYLTPIQNLKILIKRSRIFFVATA